MPQPHRQPLGRGQWARLLLREALTAHPPHCPGTSQTFLPTPMSPSRQGPPGPTLANLGPQGPWLLCVSSDWEPPEGRMRFNNPADSRPP